MYTGENLFFRDNKNTPKILKSGANGPISKIGSMFKPKRIPFKTDFFNHGFTSMNSLDNRLLISKENEEQKKENVENP